MDRIAAKKELQELISLTRNELESVMPKIQKTVSIPVAKPIQAAPVAVAPVIKTPILTPKQEAPKIELTPTPIETIHFESLHFPLPKAFIVKEIPDTGEMEKLLKKVAPQLKLSTESLDDAIARTKNDNWKAAFAKCPILFISFQPSGSQDEAIAINIQKAVDLRLKPAILYQYHSQKLEALTYINLQLFSKIVLLNSHKSTPEKLECLEYLRSLHHKESELQAVSPILSKGRLGNIPLFEVDFPAAGVNEQFKASLWTSLKTLCSS